MGTMECGIKVVMEKGKPVQIIAEDCSWTEEKIIITLPVTVFAIKENDQNPNFDESGSEADTKFG